MDTRVKLEPFITTGLWARRGAFSPDAARAMTDAVWDRIERQTMARRADPTTWGVGLPSFKPLKKHSAFRPVYQSPELRASLDRIFGVDRWKPSGSGVQILFTFPNASTWTLPDHLWHTDGGFDPTPSTRMVKVFSCLDTVAPGGGGTLAVAGSSRLVARYGGTLAADQRSGDTAAWRRLMKTDPWLDQLRRPGTEPARTHDLMNAGHDADGIELQVVEMTGEPGDHYIVDVRTLHCVAPNACDAPRIMLAAVFSAA